MGWVAVCVSWVQDQSSAGLCVCDPALSWHRSDLGVGRGLQESRPLPSALVPEGGGGFSQLFVSGRAAPHSHPNL